MAGLANRSRSIRRMSIPVLAVFDAIAVGLSIGAYIWIVNKDEGRDQGDNFAGSYPWERLEWDVNWLQIFMG